MAGSSTPTNFSPHVKSPTRSNLHKRTTLTSNFAAKHNFPIHPLAHSIHPSIHEAAAVESNLRSLNSRWKNARSDLRELSIHSKWSRQRGDIRARRRKEGTQISRTLNHILCFIGGGWKNHSAPASSISITFVPVCQC